VADIGSFSVDWWSVHTHVLPLLEEVGSWPMAGSLLWDQLRSDDPAKLAALYDAARHHILRVDTAQAALADASRDVSAAADWSAIGRDLRRRNEIYIPRRIA
jgi:hypothetical protein